MSRTPLLVVDGHNLLWRAWFGFPARIRSRDATRDLTGVFGFLALLRKAVHQLPVRPEVLVVFDGEQAWHARTAIRPTYKANRATDEVAMAPIEALADVEAGLDLIGVPRLMEPTAEADDLVASLIAKVRRHTPSRPVQVMSTDRDFFQLLDDHTEILNTTRARDRAVVTAGEVVQRFGVTPWQWCDRAALVGDPSDGLAGVPGVGTVTAARLLHGGLHVEQLPGSGRLTGKRGAAVLRRFADVLLDRDLVTLRTAIPVPRGIPNGRPAGPMPLAARVLEALELW